MIIPDVIEQRESAAERWADECFVDDEHCRCYQCGAVFHIREGNTIYNDPYAPLACAVCCCIAWTGFTPGELNFGDLIGG